MVIHCAFELGVMPAKLRYICVMAKGMGKFFLREVGEGMLNGWYIKKSQSSQLSQLSHVAIVAIRFIRHDECINNYFIIL